MTVHIKTPQATERLQPSPYYMEILAILERGDMPTPKQVFALLVHDRVVSFVRYRVQDWIYWRLDRVGLLPGASRLRVAFGDDFSIGLAAVQAEEDAAIRARFSSSPSDPRQRRCRRHA